MAEVNHEKCDFPSNIKGPFQLLFVFTVSDILDNIQQSARFVSNVIHVCNDQWIMTAMENKQ